VLHVCAHGIWASNNISHIEDGLAIFFQFSSINMEIEPITSEDYLYIYKWSGSIILSGQLRKIVMLVQWGKWVLFIHIMQLFNFLFIRCLMWMKSYILMYES